MFRTARPLSCIYLLAGLGLLLVAPPLGAQGAYIFSTYLGGTRWDAGEAIATNSSGNVYIALLTDSDDFLKLTEPPMEPPPYHPFDYEYIAVVALDPTGKLLYRTRTFGVYAGRAIRVGGIAAAPDGSVVVVGTMYMEDPQHYAFFARLSPSGQVVSSGFPGGIWAQADDVAVDDHGDFYISGTTWEDGYHHNPPTQGAAAFVFKLGSYFTRLDTPLNDYGNHIEVEPDGSVIVAGVTEGLNYSGLDKDGFLAWLAPEGAVVRSVTFGGRGDDKPSAMTILTDSSLIITGTTNSLDFPTRMPSQPPTRSTFEPFLIHVSSSGKFLKATVGGISPPPRDLAAGPNGALYVLGGDDSCRSALLARLDSQDFTVLDAACIAEPVYGTSLAVDPPGWISITGGAWTGLNLVNPIQGFYAGGDGDAFAVRMLMNRPPDCSGATARPLTIWPPNGALVPVSILGLTDSDGDSMTLRVTGIRQDEPRSGQSVDASGLGTTQPWVRAQRSGGGDGRVYHITFEARDEHGATCTGEVSVCVPHDSSGRICGDGGALEDSTRL